MSVIRIAAIIAFFLAMGAAWVTHCVWWIKLMMDGSMEVWQGVLAVLGTGRPSAPTPSSPASFMIHSMWTAIPISCGRGGVMP